MFPWNSTLFYTFLEFQFVLHFLLVLACCVSLEFYLILYFLGIPACLVFFLEFALSHACWVFLVCAAQTRRMYLFSKSFQARNAVLDKLRLLQYHPNVHLKQHSMYKKRPRPNAPNSFPEIIWPTRISINFYKVRFCFICFSPYSTYEIDSQIGIERTESDIPHFRYGVDAGTL